MPRQNAWRKIGAIERQQSLGLAPDRRGQHVTIVFIRKEELVEKGFGNIDTRIRPLAFKSCDLEPRRGLRTVRQSACRPRPFLEGCAPTTVA